jgi:hypothetical protein
MQTFTDLSPLNRYWALEVTPYSTSSNRKIPYMEILLEIVLEVLLEIVLEI